METILLSKPLTFFVCFHYKRLMGVSLDLIVTLVTTAGFSSTTMFHGQTEVHPNRPTRGRASCLYVGFIV